MVKRNTTSIIAARYFGGNYILRPSLILERTRDFNYIDKSGFIRRLHGLETTMVMCFYTLSEVSLCIYYR